MIRPWPTCSTREARGAGIDYAQLVKIYGSDPEAEKRYSPAVCVGCTPTVIQGNPDPWAVSTSYVEQSNLTMPMSIHRLTRLTNAFSKKVENLTAAVSLNFMTTTSPVHIARSAPRRTTG